MKLGVINRNNHKNAKVDKMNKIKISGVAKGQYKKLCPYSAINSEQKGVPISYKIKRAVQLGKVTHIYKNNSVIIRYYFLNFLVSEKEVMTIWMDRMTLPYIISNNKKNTHKELFLKGWSYQDIKETIGGNNVYF